MYFTHPQLKNLKPLFNKTSEAELKQKLSEFFPNREIVFTNQGRSAFQLVIEHLNLHNTEMIFPAYICDIFEPIIKKYDIKPIYIDVDLKTFNMDINQIEKNITPQTKSILVCHTYGYPNDMEKIKELAKKYDLKIIEDCARAFGIKYNGEYLGNFGDCSIFSLPKFLPATTGGMLVSKKPINIKLKRPKLKLKTLVKFIRLFPLLAAITEKFRIKEDTIKTIKAEEPRKASKQSFKILNWYLDNFEEQNNKTREIIKYFKKELGKINIKIPEQTTYISALIPNRDELLKKLRKKNIYCSRTWHNPFCPKLPNTQKAASQIINFPLQSWFTSRNIDIIIKEVKKSI